ncbi:TetR/AcrR family transcriptional regulator [uncultured Tateyamaria sp.]|uniref:TetR/AcrR family transcriptional regulator n=1 Tax=uncultured Tateyamaria sp. TaxID=455651 RepID=UPI0026255F10|nr:TetR/AcrR family transcriptional regulator [uncultured Tateyamaria sp.]
MTTTPPEPMSKRALILEAGVREFQAKGFAAASMDQVSARAGVSKRTVYKHFESKENLFLSIVETLSARLTDTLDITFVPGEPVRAQLRALAMAEGRILTSPDTMAMSRMLISETLRDPALAQAGQGKLGKTTVFADMLRAADADGQLRVPDPQAAAEEFVALIKAKAFWPVIFGADIVSPEEMERIAETSVDIILSHYAVRHD